MSKRIIERKPVRKAMLKKTSTGEKAIQVDSEENFWQQMYIIAERWQSDLMFFNDELSFFRKLISKNFMWLIDEKNIEKTRSLASDLSKFEKRRYTVSEKTGVHVRRLANLIENPFSHDAQQCKEDHQQLEMLLAEFNKDFRALKHDLFSLSEHVMGSKKVKLLFNGSQLKQK